MWLSPHVVPLSQLIFLRFLLFAAWWRSSRRQHRLNFLGLLGWSVNFFILLCMLLPCTVPTILHLCCTLSCCVSLRVSFFWQSIILRLWFFIIFFGRPLRWRLRFLFVGRWVWVGWSVCFFIVLCMLFPCTVPIILLLCCILCCCVS